jgi:7,8-dihydroneopterin aldolase/epimerase/oxygenase
LFSVSRTSLSDYYIDYGQGCRIVEPPVLQIMGTIALEGLEFFAYHGVSGEEQKIGNRYQIDIQIVTDFSEAAENDKLRDTVDYSNLYEIISDVMKIKSRLLEHIAKLIISNVRERYPDIEKIEVAVSKFNPPIGGVCTRAKVTLVG